MNNLLNDLNLLILNVGYAVHNKDWNWEDVKSPFTRLYLVTKGNARLRFPSEDVYDLSPGHLYLVPSFVCHTDICDSVFEHYYIHIYEDSNSTFRLFEDWTFPVEVQADDIDLMLFKKLCEINPSMILPQSNPDSYDNSMTLLQNLQKTKSQTICKKMESRGIVFQLVSRFLKDACPKDPVCDDRIQKVLSYIRKNINENIKINELADLSCLSKDHFIRIFKKEVGDSPNSFITEKKMERAMLRLATEDVPIKTIACDLGYDDNSYFNRLFKSRIGITPQQYRDKKKR